MDKERREIKEKVWDSYDIDSVITFSNVEVLNEPGLPGSNVTASVAIKCGYLFKPERYIRFELVAQEEWDYEGTRMYLVLYGIRLETEKEIEKRLKAAAKSAETRKKQAAKKKIEAAEALKKAEEKERELYLELKEKYDV